MKRPYVSLMRALRRVARVLGLLRWLESHRQRRTLLWLRSLFAIYDLDDMVALDIPWWTLSGTEQADRFLAARPGSRVFEFGSGASSVWLARRAAEVHTVEHDEAWADVVQPHLDQFPGATLRVVPPGVHPGEPRYASVKPGWEGLDFQAYVETIHEVGGEFDVIVIDGRARAACLEAATDHLAAGGIIVFDNSRRERYRTAIEEADLLRADFPGLTACLPYPDQTSLLSDQLAIEDETESRWPFSRFLGLVVIAASLVFLGNRIATGANDLRELSLGWQPWAGVAGVGIAYGLLLVLLVAGWGLILRRSEPGARWRNVLHVYALSGLAKYLPGNVFHLAGRQVMARRHSWRQSAVAAATGVEIVLHILAASAWIITLRALEFSDGAGRIAVIAAVAVAVVMVVLVGARVAQAVSRLGDSVAVGDLAGATALQVAFFGGNVVLAVVTLHIVAPDGAATAATVGATYLASWLAGFVTPGAPGGLGVREAILVGALGESVAAVLALAVAMRIVTTVGEAALAGSAAVIGKARRQES